MQEREETILELWGRLAEKNVEILPHLNLDGARDKVGKIKSRVGQVEIDDKY